MRFRRCVCEAGGGGSGSVAGGLAGAMGAQGTSGASGLGVCRFAVTFVYSCLFASWHPQLFTGITSRFRTGESLRRSARPVVAEPDPSYAWTVRKIMSHPYLNNSAMQHLNNMPRMKSGRLAIDFNFCRVSWISSSLPFCLMTGEFLVF